MLILSIIRYNSEYPRQNIVSEQNLEINKFVTTSFASWLKRMRKQQHYY
jgi:hypothetical protein